jgi:hypothetical protein
MIDHRDADLFDDILRRAKIAGERTNTPISCG